MEGLVIVSNGHGEDVIGASLALSLARLAPGLPVHGFPLVDDGRPYREASIERLGPCRTMPSGGFTVHSLPHLVADVRAGFVGMTLRQMAALARLRCDALLVVGDVYAQGLAALARAPFRAVFQPLVSVRLASSGRPPPVNRTFMERITLPERVLMRRLAGVVYTRDDATAAWLRERGVRQAVWLGNPMVDRAAGRPMAGLNAAVTVALLPGTRAYSTAALGRMAEALARMPGATGVVAWHGGPVPDMPGWRPDGAKPPERGRTLALRRGGSRLWVVEGRFGDVLASARLAIGTAGTAHEQAAAYGLPVVAFPLEPHYSRAYLANQQRLLGDALTVTEADPSSIAQAARRLLADEAAWARASRAGRARMGGPGGSDAVAADLLKRLRDGAPRRPVT